MNRKVVELEAVKEDLECRVSNFEALEEELREAQNLVEVRQEELAAMHQKLLTLEQHNTELSAKCEHLEMQV